MVSHSDGVVLAHRRELLARGIPDAAVTRYLARPRGSDPVLRRILATRRPAHERSVLGEARWHAHELYRSVARPYGIEHYMLAPVIAGGRIVAVIAAFRHTGAPAFDDADLAAIEGVAALVAVAAGWMRERDPELTRELQSLSDRQRLIATYVAKGLPNRDIAAMLGLSVNTVKKHLKAMFQKLGVSRRAELTWIATTGGLV